MSGAGKAQRDTITVLRSKDNSKPLTKRFRNDGSVDGYSLQWRYGHASVEIQSFAGAVRLLDGLQRQPGACVIRGRLVADEQSRAVAVAAWQDSRRARKLPYDLPGDMVPRVGGVFADQALHLMMLDIDNYAPGMGHPDPVQAPEAAALGFIKARLPDCFQGRSFWWQLSASAGRAENVGLLKVHIWFWSATAYCERWSGPASIRW